MEYLPLFHDFGMPRQSRVGPGPGSSALLCSATAFVTQLCLADINPEAIEACRLTVTQNGLAERVTIYHSDNLDGIPTSEQWDLVAGNPPHFVHISPGELRFRDEDWKLHWRSSQRLGAFSGPVGSIVLLKNNRGSTAETFRSMIEAAGLCIVFVHNCEGRRPYTRIYYIGIARRGDAVPACTDKLARELGFRAGTPLTDRLRVDWYLSNERWWRAVQTGAYRDWMKLQGAALTGSIT